MKRRRSAPAATPNHPSKQPMYGIEGLLAGRTLVDRYLVLEVIGRGGMGAVYRARDQRLGREVALKVVTVAAPGPEAETLLRARFQREARAAAGLHHPNVVAVHDFGTDPQLELDFLVMELLRGEDLAARLARSGALRGPDAIEILYQAARGLAAGHRAGLIHRDVKPGNIYLERSEDGDVRVRVLDFGIAEIARPGDATVTHLTLVGRSPFSPAFASPEQLRGESRLTPATDVFSLGAVGYSMVTGARAFTAADPREMVVELSAAMAALRDRAPSISPELLAVLRRALAPAPEDRYPDAAALAQALVRQRPGSADTGGLPESPPPVSRPAARYEGRSPDWTRGTVAVPPRPDQRERHREDLSWTRATVAPPPAVPAGAAPGTPSAGRAPAARQGCLRRTARAVGSFLLTAGALALFAAAWAGVAAGLENRDLLWIYGSATATVFCTPLAVHRVLRRRGSPRLTLFASVVGSIGVVFLMGGRERIEALLAILFMVQVVLSTGAELLTPREFPAPEGPGDRNR